jgi:hypothetical protein
MNSFYIERGLVTGGEGQMYCKRMAQQNCRASAFPSFRFSLVGY